MPLLNSIQRYGGIAKTFHWLTALLVLTLIPLGILANGAAHAEPPNVARAAWLFSLHKTFGVTLFAVALLRILWALLQIKPAALHPDRRLESFAAEVVHWILYAALVLVPLTGWISHAASEGFAPIWWSFGQGLPLVPKDPAVKVFFGQIHIVFERVLVISLVLHVAGALKHQFIDRDSTLVRMWFGRSEQPELIGGHGAQKRPIIAATLAYVAAIGVAIYIGHFERAAPGIAPEELAAVASDWEVQDGATLGITVTQFGSVVEGTFADWTAEITFDETPSEVQGSVDVVINVGSLTLGSVTDQAMGPDFFDVSTHPTANFSGAIRPAGDGIFEAVGILSIKGIEKPITLLFDLNIVEDRAEMLGTLELDRLDFGIGENMADEGSLLFAVEVRVALTATKVAQ